MNFKLIILIIILLIIFIKINKKTKESFTNNGNQLYYFYSSKSDFSMNIIPIWQQLKQLKIKKSDLIFYDINTDKHKKITSEMNVSSVPKIILKQKTIPIIYNGDFTLKDIINFLKLNNVFVNSSLLDLE